MGKSFGRVIWVQHVLIALVAHEYKNRASMAMNFGFVRLFCICQISYYDESQNLCTSVCHAYVQSK